MIIIILIIYSVVVVDILVKNLLSKNKFAMYSIHLTKSQKLLVFHYTWELPYTHASDLPP
jgi:hypothetical protein